mgnify:CR=1 FL=1
MGLKRVFASMLVALLVGSCAERAEPTQEVIEIDMVERQKMYLAQERQLIERYIESHQLDGIERNGFGMYELQMSEGEGRKAEMEDRVIYSATVYLMDDSGVGQYVDTIALGRSQIELGLHTAIEGMKEGEKKLVLIPSFLAKGLAGDLDKVPPQSPLRYDIRLIQVDR